MEDCISHYSVIILSDLDSIRINASHADLEEYSVFPAKYKPQLFCGASLLQQLFVGRLKCLRGILWHLCRDFWNVKDSYKHSLWPSYFFPWAAHFHCAVVDIYDVLLWISTMCTNIKSTSFMPLTIVIYFQFALLKSKVIVLFRTKRKMFFFSLRN